MVYVLLDEQSDGYRLPVSPAGFALVLTLEVVVGDDYGSYLMLDYQSGLSRSSGFAGASEGFWALPFESFRADPRHARPSTAGSVRRLYEEFESTIDAREAMERFAWLLGREISPSGGSAAPPN